MKAILPVWNILIQRRNTRMVRQRKGINSFLHVKKTWINIDLLFSGQLSSSHASASTERRTASTSLLWQSTPMKISSQLPLSLRKNYLSGSSPYWKFIWLTKFQKGKSSNLFTVKKILFISLRLMCTQH